MYVRVRVKDAKCLSDTTNVNAMNEGDERGRAEGKGKQNFFIVQEMKLTNTRKDDVRSRIQTTADAVIAPWFSPSNEAQWKGSHDHHRDSQTASFPSH